MSKRMERRQRREAENVGKKILSETLSPSETQYVEFGGKKYRVTDSLRLPKNYYDKKTGMAPIQITATDMYGTGEYQTSILSGEWSKYIRKDGKLAENTAPKSDVWYQPVGKLVSQAPTTAVDALGAGMSWLQESGLTLQEREPSVEEIEEYRYYPGVETSYKFLYVINNEMQQNRGPLAAILGKLSIRH